MHAMQNSHKELIADADVVLGDATRHDVIVMMMMNITKNVYSLSSYVQNSVPFIVIAVHLLFSRFHSSITQKCA